MSLERYGSLISALIDGELSTTQRTEVLAHLRECAECAALFNQYRQIRASFRDLDPLEPPPALAESIGAHTRSTQRPAYPRQLIRRLSGVAATFLLAISTAVALGWLNQPWELNLSPGYLYVNQTTVAIEHQTIEVLSSPTPTATPSHAPSATPPLTPTPASAPASAPAPAPTSLARPLINTPVAIVPTVTPRPAAPTQPPPPALPAPSPLPPTVAAPEEATPAADAEPEAESETIEPSPEPEATMPPPAATGSATATPRRSTRTTRPTPRPTSTRPVASPTRPAVVVAPAVTAGPGPTRIAPLATTPPPTPQPTPSPTAPTLTTPPPTNQAPSFAQLYHENAELRLRLGLALERERELPVIGQLFERGSMEGLVDDHLVLVLYSDSRTWARFTVTSADEATTPTATPPSGLYRPRRSLGRVWNDHPVVRDRLGWAIAPDQSHTGPFQRFERGLMLRSSVGAILVLYEDGTWQRY